MLKKIIYLTLASAIVCTFSCKKTDDTKVLNSTDAENTVSTAGDKVASSIVALQNDPSTLAVKSLSNYPLNSINGMAQALTKTFVAAANVNSQESAQAVYVNLKSANALDPGMQSSGGIYTYNFTTHEFDRVASTTVIEFHYPANSADSINKVNSAVLSISNILTDSLVTNQTIGNYTYTSVKKEPKTINATLTISGNQVASYSFSGTYDASLNPTNISSNLTLGKFSWVVNYTLTSTSIVFNQTLQQSGTTFLGYGLNSTGDFSSLNAINDSNSYQKINTITYWIQVGNLKLNFNADFASNRTAIANMAQSKTAPTVDQEVALLSKVFTATLLDINNNNAIVGTGVIFNNSGTLDVEVKTSDKTLTVDQFFSAFMAKIEASLPSNYLNIVGQGI